jgi:hypothetical protein
LLGTAVALVVVSLWTGAAHALDSDGDGIPNEADNCVLAANPSQLDVDRDGYGNACDADFDNDGLVNLADSQQIKSAFLRSGAAVREQDLDGNGIVNLIDLQLFRGLFLRPPPPSGALLPPSILFDGVSHGQLFDSPPGFVTGRVPNLASTDGEIVINFDPDAPSPVPFTPPAFGAPAIGRPFIPVLVDARRLSTGAWARERIVLVAGDTVPFDARPEKGMSLVVNPSGLDRIETLLERAVAPFIDDLSAEIQGRNPLADADDLTEPAEQLDATGGTIGSVDVELVPVNGSLQAQVKARNVRIPFHLTLEFFSDCDGAVTMSEVNVRLNVVIRPNAADPARLAARLSRDPSVSFTGFDYSTDCGADSAILRDVVALFTDDPDVRGDVRDAILDLLTEDGPLLAALNTGLDSFELDDWAAGGFSFDGAFEQVQADTSGLRATAAIRVDDSTPTSAPPELSASLVSAPGVDPLFPASGPNGAYGMALAIRDSELNQLLRSATEEGLFDAFVRQGDVTEPEGAPTGELADQIQRCIAADFTFGCLPPDIALLLPQLPADTELMFAMRATLAPIVRAPTDGAGDATIEARQVLLDLVPVARPSESLIRFALDVEAGVDVAFGPDRLLQILPAGEPKLVAIPSVGMAGSQPGRDPRFLDREIFPRFGLPSVLVTRIAPVLKDLLPSVPLPAFPGADLVGAGSAWDATSGSLLVFADLLPHPAVAGAAETSDRFGEALAVGDFNGDGRQDLAVGVPGEGVRTDPLPGFVPGEGAVNVLLGTASGLSSKGNQIFDQETPGLGGGSEIGDAFGAALGAGDFDGDGYDDLAIGVPGEDIDAAEDAGLVQILRGSPVGPSAIGARTISQAVSGVPGDAEDGDGFGRSLAIGNFDADPFDDLVVGVPGEAVGGLASAGLVHLFRGSAQGLVLAGSIAWTQNSTGIPGNAEFADQFGRTLVAGDLDGDGFDDVAIGSPGEAIGSALLAGSVTILYGSSSGLVTSRSQSFHQDTAGVPGAAEAGDSFAASLAAGDVDGDGDDDLAIGIPNENIGSIDNAGSVIVLRGAVGGLTVAGAQDWHQDSLDVADAAELDDRFGSSLAMGDFDGDGRADLAVGVPGEDLFVPPALFQVNEGAVAVLHGSSGGLTAAGNRDQLWSQDSLPERPQAGDYFGQALAAGDLDGDGRSDLAIGVPGENSREGAAAGAVNTLHGTQGTGLTSARASVWSQNR